MMENKKSKAFLIVVSVLIAFGVWLYVDSANGTKATTYANDIPVEFVGENTIQIGRAHV